MYAVIYENRVIVGPMAWNRAIFQGSLAKQGVHTQLPRVVPEQLPLVINEQASIMGVEEIRPEFNPYVEYLYGPLWNILPDRAQATYAVYDSPIPAARFNLKQLTAEERYRREVAGVTHEVQGTPVTLDTSRDGKNIFVQTLALMTDDQIINWKFPECWLPLTKPDLASCVAAGAAHIQAAFDWEKQISDQIDAAETKAELLAIEILPPPPSPPGPFGDVNLADPT
jgi:hypothetical protein